MQQPGFLDDLRRMSARVGANILLVQGAGGNSSVKQDDVLWVKASGAWLSEAKEKEHVRAGGAPRRARCLGRGQRKMPVAGGFGEVTLRASIETSLHALMPHPVVLHVHAVNTIAWAALEGVEAELSKRLEGLAWRQLPYRRPGLPLSQVVAEHTAKTRADVLILGNHGLLVGADTCDAAEALIAEVERRLESASRAWRRPAICKTRCSASAAALPIARRPTKSVTASPPARRTSRSPPRARSIPTMSSSSARLCRVLPATAIWRGWSPMRRRSRCRRRWRCWCRVPAPSSARMRAPAPRRCWSASAWWSRGSRKRRRCAICLRMRNRRSLNWDAERYRQQMMKARSA